MFRLFFAVSCTLFISFLSHAESTSESAGELLEIVITAEQTDAPLTVVTDPKNPRQPLPAHDGADYLKTIPGFNVTRKGGTDGDPVFRGMAASRLGILVDGENILGGCNARMDAPTAYIYPEIYDVLTVIKGPQTVLYGSGNSAATVLFERKIENFIEPGYRLHASALAASADRRDMFADMQVGNRLGYVQLTTTDSTANDYKDGNGDTVHSEYHRYSGNAALGWTPDENTRLELATAISDGEAAYADRSMDGTQFSRESHNIRIERKNISPLFNSVELHVYQNSIDHIMDDQEMRTPGTMGYSNLERETDGARLTTELALTDDSRLTLGTDIQNNQHNSRNAPAKTHIYTAWQDDANFNQYAFFAELNQDINHNSRFITGYRSDRWKATDERPAMIMTSMMPMVMSANPSSGDTRQESLDSGFARIEHTLPLSPATIYAGLGHSERFPDYWEMIAKQGERSASAFYIDTEKTNQLDLGVLYKTRKIDFSLSAYYSKINDFILVDYSNMMKMNGFARNIDATAYGSELGVAYALTAHWKLDSSVAWVWGKNETDNTALAQLPPLEARLGTTYQRDNWSIGGLMRVVDDQDRYALRQGTIVGQDLQPSGGFTVYSLNASWKPTPDLLLTTGIDNLFDKNYAEFISRAGGTIPGYVQTTRVNEPGRTLWLKAQLVFD